MDSLPSAVAPIRRPVPPVSVITRTGFIIPIRARSVITRRRRHDHRRTVGVRPGSVIPISGAVIGPDTYVGRTTACQRKRQQHTGHDRKQFSRFHSILRQRVDCVLLRQQKFTKVYSVCRCVMYPRALARDEIDLKPSVQSRTKVVGT